MTAHGGGAGHQQRLDRAQGAGRLRDRSPAVLARISCRRQVSEEQTLPSSQEQAEGVGPKGAAAKIACPAPGDCWLATTARAGCTTSRPNGERTLAKDEDPEVRRD